MAQPELPNIAAADLVTFYVAQFAPGVKHARVHIDPCFARQLTLQHALGGVFHSLQKSN
jgi:hypothetical protein